MARSTIHSNDSARQSSPNQAALTTPSKPKLIVLTGTTAVGKSRLAVMLAQKLNGELVNADSVKVYKHLEVGSNKQSVVKSAKSHNIPLHMVDVVDPGEVYNVGHFVKDVNKVVADIHARGRVPILVGGSAMYIDRFLSRDHTLVPEVNEQVMVKINSELQNMTWEEGLDRLRAFDPISASKLLKNDYLRLSRALEMFESHGVIKSELQHKQPDKASIPFDVRAFVFSQPRLPLYRSIDARCEDMLVEGLMEETFEHFYGGGQTPSIIGYLDFLAYVESSDDTITEESFLNFLDSFQTKTRNLAKKQITWFRHSKVADYFWLGAEDPTELKRQEKRIRVKTGHKDPVTEFRVSTPEPGPSLIRTEMELSRVSQLLCKLVDCDTEEFLKQRELYSQKDRFDLRETDQRQLRCYVSANRRFCPHTREGRQNIQKALARLFELKRQYAYRIKPNTNVINE